MTPRGPLGVLLVTGTVMVALFGVPVVAQAPADGELVVHYNRETVCCTFSFLEILTPEGIARNNRSAAPEGDILLAPNGNVYVSTSTFPNLQIYSTTFAFIGSISTPAPTRFLAMDAADLLYVATATGDVNRYTISGAVVDTIHVGLHPGDEIAAGDLGRDQCTLYYLTGSGHVRRYDVCRQAQLPDVGNANVCFGNNAPQSSLRVANDGAVLVAGCDSAFRFTGQSVRTYPMRSEVIAPTADARFFWTGRSTLSLVDVETGAVVRGPIALAPSERATAIEIAGALRASLAADATQIPAVSLPSLLFLGVMLGVLGLVALRR